MISLYQSADNLKNDRMISVRFQGKPFKITVFQVYAPKSNAEEDEVEWLSEDLQDLLELTLKKELNEKWKRNEKEKMKREFFSL